VSWPVPVVTKAVGADKPDTVEAPSEAPEVLEAPLEGAKDGLSRKSVVGLG
jgi:hypothetical protein